MEEIDQNLIDRYLAHELTASERAGVEQRIKDDPLFRQEVLDYEMALKSLQIRQREVLRQRFKDRDKILDAGNPDSSDPQKIRLLWAWVVAILVIGLLLWKFVFASDHPAATINHEDKDTIQIDQPNLRDTIPSKNEDPSKTPGTGKDKITEQQRMDMAAAQKEGEELFADNFEPYTDESMSPVSRGDKDLLPLDKFRKSYWEGKYQEANVTFSSLSTDHQKNENLRFVYALSLSASERVTEAQAILKSIIENNRSVYIEEAHWYLGLLYLKQGDVPNARIYFQHCVDAADGYNKQKAKSILDQIEN